MKLDLYKYSAALSHMKHVEYVPYISQYDINSTLQKAYDQDTELNKVTTHHRRLNDYNSFNRDEWLKH